MGWVRGYLPASASGVHMACLCVYVCVFVLFVFFVLFFFCRLLPRVVETDYKTGNKTDSHFCIIHTQTFSGLSPSSIKSV